MWTHILCSETNIQRKITSISRYGLFCVSRQTSAEVTWTRQNYKVSTWIIHHQILWENTHYIPSKSRIASVTATIVSNIIQNTLCNNVPHFLKLQRIYWLLMASQDLCSIKSKGGRKWNTSKGRRHAWNAQHCTVDSWSGFQSQNSTYLKHFKCGTISYLGMDDAPSFKKSDRVSRFQ